MSNPESGEDMNNGIDSNKKKILWILELVLSPLSLVFVSIFVFLIEYYLDDIYFSYPIRVYADSFAIGGILGLCYWLLLWASREGAFDMIVYGSLKLWSFMFRVHPEKSNLPSTYYDYVMLKKQKRHHRFMPLLFCALLFLVVGVILTFVSLNLEY